VVDVVLIDAVGSKAFAAFQIGRVRLGTARLRRGELRNDFRVLFV
jgi:hypothetical protein